MCVCLSFYIVKNEMKSLLIYSIPGSVLEKNRQGGSAYFFGSEILIFLFFWVWKNLSYFFGSEDFSLIFLG